MPEHFMVGITRSYIGGMYGQMHLRMAQPAVSQRTALLCIHMSPMSGRTFEPLMKTLGEGRLMLAFDTPGFGMSDAPGSPPSIEDYARALARGWIPLKSPSRSTSWAITRAR